jgi:oxygen-independent coproporphyrinogen-3 oxidase
MVREGRASPYNARIRARAQREIARLSQEQGFERTSVWSFTKTGSPAYTTVTRESYIGFGAGAGSRVDGTFWFNTFSVPEYNKLREPRAALASETSERFRRYHWLYWQIYNTVIDPQRCKELFGRDFVRDFGLHFKLLQMAGWAVRRDGLWVLTERGSRWSHRIQMLFSLTFIDEMWSQCQAEPWPERIVLH